MKLESIIKKSRKLLNKFKSNGKIILSEEDYFMLSVSLFVAKKESIIKKDNSSNTLYFDYNKYKREYERYSHVIDEISKSSTINIVTPDNKRYDLTKDRCFDRIDDLVFPLNGKIEVLNFDGTIEELNEIKRVIWIISKIRDSFVHGDKFSFDFENKKIKIDNSISDKILGEFEIKIDIDPKLLVYLCEKENIYKDYEFYDNYNYNIKYKYDYYDNIIDNEFKEPFKIKKNYFREDIIISKISRELDYINDIKVLNELKNILMKFSKIHNKLTVEEKEKFFKRFLRLIKMYSERSKQDSLACRNIIELLTELLISDNDYYSVLYSHMIFVFSDTKAINANNLRFSKFNIENDIFKEKIKNKIRSIVNILNNLRDSNRYSYLDASVSRDKFVVEMNELFKLLYDRNNWILNKIRNGVEHKNVDFINENDIVIYDRKDNRSDVRDFSCSISCSDLDGFLSDIENNVGELSVIEFLSEIKSIVGEMQSFDVFEKYLLTINNYLDDSPPSL